MTDQSATIVQRALLRSQDRWRRGADQGVWLYDLRTALEQFEGILADLAKESVAV